MITTIEELSLNAWPSHQTCLYDGGVVVLIAMAFGYYFVMLMFAPQSTDPVEMIKVVGQVSGAMIGISLVMIVLGLIGKKA